MKRGLLVAISMLLVACGPYGKDVTANFSAMPNELSDCKIYEISSKTYVLNVVRCPNSSTSTTYQQGKTSATVVVIDGAEYVKKEQ